MPEVGTTTRDAKEAGLLRLVVVDDEPLARNTLRLLARLDPEVVVVAECGNGAEAIQAILEHRPDLVFLDVQMPELDGFAVLEALG
ncbi:MAG TPA: response regulator, partial [Thermoanaerobaculia bacterium]|nr:response regulator [Thermoanaerobaculia bacterium]